MIASRLAPATITFVVIGVVALVSFQANRKPLRLPATANAADPANYTLHDAGSVLGGKPIAHEFEFRNQGEHVLRIEQESDIRKSCGCTQIEISSRHLQPGEATTIRMAIDTTKKRGPMEEVVELTWTDPKRQRHRVAYAIRARVDSAIVWSPRELVFDSDEVRSGEIKTLRCTSDYPVRWQDAVVGSDDPFVEIIGRTLDDNGRALLIQVACHGEGTGSSRQGQLLIKVPNDGAHPNGAPAFIEETYELFAQDTTTRRVSPQIPTFSWSESQQGWQGHVIVTSDQFAADHPSDACVSRIVVAAATVAHYVRPLHAHAKRLDLIIRPTDELIGRVQPPSSLQIHWSTGGSTQLDARFVDTTGSTFANQWDLSHR